GNADAIAMMMNKDRGKAMLQEGLQKEKEQNGAMTQAIAHQFAESTANQKLKEAQVAKEQSEKSQNAATISVLAKGSLKKQFKAALQAKNVKLLRDLAARMLQNVWAGRKARITVQVMKAERQRLLEDGYVCKLQSRYRSHLAKLRVVRLKAEKQRLKEEGCAIIVQSAWRIKQAKRKVAALKLKKQRLLEEGAALKLQAAWRIKQAKQRVSQLKTARNEKQVAMAKAGKIISNLLIGHHARQKYKQILLHSRHLLILHLARAKHILAGDVNSSDPYFFVHLDNNVSTLNSSTANKSRVKSSSFTDMGRTLSQYKSKIIYKTLNPVWNEDCIVVMNSGPAYNVALANIVLTLMDKDNFSSDDFLGQVSGSYKLNVLMHFAIMVISFCSLLYQFRGRQVPYTLGRLSTSPI
ncbi:hypothetical protein EON65_20480, partial [archaeon]